MKKLLPLVAFCLSIISLHSQNKLILENCNDLVNGPHTQGKDIDGCDCYNRDDGTGYLLVQSNGFLVGWYGSFGESFTCEYKDPLVDISGVLIRGPVNGACSVSDFDLTNLNGGCSITLIPELIPTLSQWGIMILGLILSIFGIVAVRNRVFKLA